MLVSWLSVVQYNPGGRLDRFCPRIFFSSKGKRQGLELNIRYLPSTGFPHLILHCVRLISSSNYNRSLLFLRGDLSL